MKRTISYIICMALLLMSIPALAGTDQVGREQAQSTVQWSRTTASHYISANQVSMTQTAAVIMAAAAPAHYRYSITIRNLDAANTVYLGAASVTSATGFPLKPGESFTLDRNDAAIYGICGSGLTATVAYFEEGY